MDKASNNLITRSSKYKEKKEKLIKKKIGIKKRTNKNNKYIPNSFFGEIKKNKF